ncbi:NADPH-dependent F420 reductase [Pararoseomonas indoligenes]|uniref:NAD(P)-binding domain-containing protein n=1 Tax=Roseomonas indoligenes TaxID=2820811 RepID=A0A940SAA5_9PROT|nr:NAD(P)-binding domain-containing protein [Pararoseomonas indoligenes]MBP0495987.1 NAD(P)-binding domain-containing protein [Pararoseomonas indoligenes]
MTEAADPILRRALLLAGGAALILPAPRGAMAQPASRSPVGIIGSGRLGGTVGTLLARAGHPVLFSSRHPERLKELVEAAGPNARAGLPAEAAAFGEALLVAVPYGALPDVGKELGAALRGKVVLDACNAVVARDGAVGQAAIERGIGLASAEHLPGARVVRAFNTLGSRVLAEQAHRAGAPVAIPLAGDDAAALEAAAALVRDAGFDPVIVGPLARAPEFAMGARGYGQAVTAPELRQILGLSG